MYIEAEIKIRNINEDYAALFKKLYLLMHCGITDYFLENLTDWSL